MRSGAATVEQYLAALAPDRRAAVEAVRAVILQNLDGDIEEGMQYGMIGYYVPHRVFPAGYHCDPRQPLPFAGLASQKNAVSVYLMCVYGSPEMDRWFRDAWARTGKRLDMGKSCIRFRKLEDVALEVIGEAVRRVTAAGYVERYQATLASHAATRQKAPARASKGAEPATAPASKRTRKTPSGAASKAGAKSAAPTKAATRTGAAKGTKAAKKTESGTRRNSGQRR